ncbi:hypothetical protein AVEN_3461-1 [Araneus ventricosus]|uniref:Uncharacterized protein n=1 Tax=Araneus ventricosus TaxID=182803 RepID=A0A4Y2V1I9_ARAVE|nr:hypothetical protein AVEN_3461-1 [Araneus ventricosus]
MGTRKPSHLWHTQPVLVKSVLTIRLVKLFNFKNDDPSLFQNDPLDWTRQNMSWDLHLKHTSWHLNIETEEAIALLALLSSFGKIRRYGYVKLANFLKNDDPSLFSKTIHWVDTTKYGWDLLPPEAPPGI